MKKTAIYAVTVLFSTFGVAFGQSATEQNLNNAIFTAENIQQDVQTAGNAIDKLVAELTVIGNPDAVYFYDQMYFLINNVQNNADDVYYFIGEAEAASQVPFSTDEVVDLTIELVNLNDIVIGLREKITEAVNDNRDQDALALIPDLRSAIAAQSMAAGDIISLVEDIRAATTVYEVVITLVDGNGNPVQGYDLHGYWAYDHATGTYITPDRHEQDNLFFLPAGTYTFDSFDGYWSGTSSSIVTLSSALVNEDGVIIVELVYWSE